MSTRPKSILSVQKSQIGSPIMAAESIATPISENSGTLELVLPLGHLRIVSATLPWCTVFPEEGVRHAQRQHWTSAVLGALEDKPNGKVYPSLFAGYWYSLESIF